MAFLKLSTSRKCSQLLLQESLRNAVYSRLVRSLTTANGPAEPLHRRNNSVAATASTATGTIDSKPKWDSLDTSFADPEATFKSKTTWEILRAYIVYQLCSSSYLVENNMQVTVRTSNTSVVHLYVLKTQCYVYIHGILVDLWCFHTRRHSLIYT